MFLSFMQLIIFRLSAYVLSAQFSHQVVEFSKLYAISVLIESVFDFLL